jgi:hypothetical protein
MLRSKREDYSDIDISDVDYDDLEPVRRRGRGRPPLNGSSSSSSRSKTTKTVKKVRYRTAYQLYVIDKFHETKQELPNHRQSDVYRTLAIRWLEMTPEDKHGYEIKSAQDKAEREKKKIENRANRGKSRIATVRKTFKTAADLLPRPKRYLTPYMIFCNEKREALWKAHPGYRVGQLAGLMGEGWRELTDEEKQVYVDAAQEDKERYEREWAEFKVKREAMRKELPKKVQRKKKVRSNMGKKRKYNIDVLEIDPITETPVLQGLQPGQETTYRDIGCFEDLVEGDDDDDDDDDSGVGTEDDFNQGYDSNEGGEMQGLKFKYTEGESSCGEESGMEF